MKSRIYKTPLGKFEEAQYPGGNFSGKHPLNDYVSILFDRAPEKTEGGIFLSDDTKENNTYASEAGVLIEAGDGAFKWSADRQRPFEGRKPGPGDRVYFERYAGAVIHGEDGLEYRLMEDRCVAAIASEPVEKNPA